MRVRGSVNSTASRALPSCEKSSPRCQANSSGPSALPCVAVLRVGDAVLADGEARADLLLVGVPVDVVDEVGLGEDHVRLGDAELLGDARVREVPGRRRPVGQLGEEPLRGGVEAEADAAAAGGVSYSGRRFARDSAARSALDGRSLTRTRLVSARGCLSLDTASSYSLPVARLRASIRERRL